MRPSGANVEIIMKRIAFCILVAASTLGSAAAYAGNKPGGTSHQNCQRMSYQSAWVGMNSGPRYAFN